MQQGTPPHLQKKKHTQNPAQLEYQVVCVLTGESLLTDKTAQLYLASRKGEAQPVAARMLDIIRFFFPRLYLPLPLSFTYLSLSLSLFLFPLRLGRFSLYNIS
jgi:hypothetical protein